MKRFRVSSILVVIVTSHSCTSCGSNTNSSTKAQASTATAPTVEATKVASKKLSISTRLPGELQAYEAVAVFPKVTAYVDSISVDRGTRVKSGQLMALLVAPEVAAQRAEAQSKLQAAEAQRAEAEAKLASDQSTYDRLKSASATPGVVAGNDLEIAQKAAEADRARLQALREGAEAAKSALKSMITGGCRGKQQSSDDSTISLPGYGPRLSSAFRPLPVRHSRGRLCCSFRGREDADHAGRTRRQQFGRAFELRDVS